MCIVSNVEVEDISNKTKESQILMKKTYMLKYLWLKEISVIDVGQYYLKLKMILIIYVKDAMMYGKHFNN